MEVRRRISGRGDGGKPEMKSEIRNFSENQMVANGDVRSGERLIICRPVPLRPGLA